jgi:hypothetical protein
VTSTQAVGQVVLLMILQSISTYRRGKHTKGIATSRQHAHALLPHRMVHLCRLFWSHLPMTALLTADVTVLCHTEAREQILAYTSSLSLDITIKVISKSSIADNLGSAEVLALLKNTITVLSLNIQRLIRAQLYRLACDSYTTLPATEFLAFHAAQRSSATALFFDASQNSDLANLKLKDDNSLYTCYEASTDKILLLKSALDVHKSLDVRSSLFWRYPQLNISTTLQDAHIYIFEKWIIDLIQQNKNIASLRTDLFPLLAKMQWQSNLRKREGIDKRNPPPPPHPSQRPVSQTCSGGGGPTCQRISHRPSYKSQNRISHLSPLVHCPANGIHTPCKFNTNVPPTEPPSRPLHPGTTKTPFFESRAENICWPRLPRWRELHVG